MNEISGTVNKHFWEANFNLVLEIVDPVRFFLNSWGPQTRLSIAFY